MEKHKVLVSFVEKAPRHNGDSHPQSRLLALTSDGKRLVRLQPDQQPGRKCQLIGVLTEKSSNSLEATRRQIRIEPKTAAIALQLHLEDENAAIVKHVAGTGNGTGCGGGGGGGGGGPIKQKIPRPANAFMLFANEWRKKLAVENPRESNKDISVRLGVLWKTMSKDVKEKYFALAREVDAEHKRKYPGSCYLD